MKTPKISIQITLILNFFLMYLLAVLLRLWYLSVVQHEYYLKESKKPQTRLVIEKPARGTIYDRFGIPLAQNAPQYNATIRYADIRQIPKVKWEKNEKGKKIKILARQQYITELAQFLGGALFLDPLDIEDFIHGKACIFPHTPFTLAEDLPEATYYQLKAAQRNWIGLEMQQTTKRVYPQGKLACDVLGYLGTMSPQKYLAIGKEMQALRTYVEQHKAGQAIFLPKGFSNPEEVSKRLQELEEIAYTINDQVGKSGIEAAFDETLRGSIGKSFYEVDAQGNILSKFPLGKPAKTGQRVVLTLSSKLQEEAEKLLAAYEYEQDLRDAAKKKPRRHPWQRGGAIVAMDPTNGEILALASYPRFNPNDFLPKQTLQKRQEMTGRIFKWLENLHYIGEIWDGKRPMERELFIEGKYITDTNFLTWDTYLDRILPKDSVLRKCLGQTNTLEKAIHFNTDLLTTIPNEKDRILFLDLLSLAVPKEHFTSSMLSHVGIQTLSEFRSLCQLAASFLCYLKKEAKTHFHAQQFRTWREKNFKDFLRKKRKMEKEKGWYTRPYTEYLEHIEKEMFTKYWKENRENILYQAVMETPELFPIKEILLPMEKSDQFAYLRALQEFEELTTPLIGTYPHLRNANSLQTKQHLAAAFYPYNGFGCGRSQAFRQASPMGSTFKVIPAFAGLKQQYDQKEKNLNPLTLIDSMQWTSHPGSNSQVLGYLPNGDPIYRLYKGGKLPRAYSNIGEIDIISALERSSNIYFSILAGDVLSSPLQLLQTARIFGLGMNTGIDLPGEYPGVLPTDILHNKTGLYSFAIGQHSLIVTPLQAAVLFSAIANKGLIFRPKILKDANSSIVKHTMDFPKQVQGKLLEGLYKVVNGDRGTAKPTKTVSLFHDKELTQTYQKLAPQMVGKTGTAEILYKQTIDAESTAEMEKHTWFAAIGFEEETLKRPELVVIVYSRFGSAGRQGAPLCAKMIQKWREIKNSPYTK